MQAERRKQLLTLAAGIAGVALVYFAGDYLLRGQFIETTDDAYVRADSAVIQARVAGYAVSVPVQDHQRVAAGDIIAVIDPTDFSARLVKAKAEAEAKAAATQAFDARLAAAADTIAIAEARLAGAVADQERAANDLARAADLKRKGAGTDKTYDSALTDSEKAKAALEAAQAQLAFERQQIAQLTAQRAQAAAEAEAAKAQVAVAQFELDNTVVRAPFAGVIGNKSLTQGQYVRAGLQIAVVVPLNDIYIVANFKETQAGVMRRGQSVTIHVDAFPGRGFTGRIVSFSPATGSEFALIPPENATGNFTKIVQRLPIRVALDSGQEGAELLRPGMSVTAAVDTRDEGEGAAATLAPADASNATAKR